MLALLIVIISCQVIPPITSYTASYGPYYAEIPVNDNTKCGNNHYQRAWERAREVEEAQREEAFWVE